MVQKAISGNQRIIQQCWSCFTHVIFL